MTRNKAKKDSVVRALQDLGLNENEASLYAHMLSHPTNTVRELTTRSLLPRTMLYYVLRGLVAKGLVTEKKRDWKTVYVAESPEKLYDLLALKEREFEREHSALTKLIPTLKHRYLLAGKRPTVRMFDGLDEYKKALDDSVAEKPSEICAFEILAPNKPAIQVRIDHERKRLTKKIKKRVLFFEDAISMSVLKGRLHDEYTEYRAITDRTLPRFDVDLSLYRGKLLYSSYYDEHEPAAILVEDLALYRMQQSLFDLLWSQGKDRTLECL